MPEWLPSGREAFFVMIGGGTGALARLTLARALFVAAVQNPWPTALINIVGSFALGLIIVACRERPGLLLLLGAGLCGGFTTFSTFGVETARLLADARYGLAAVYALTSVCGAVGGAIVGERLMVPQDLRTRPPAAGGLVRET